MSVRYRLLTIAALIALSIFALFPRTVTVRQQNKATGMWENVKIKRVPLKKGLDLQGGMHLALEVDESRGAVADKPQAIERALKVVRTRIDQFGVSEPVVQKVGADRIIVELPGIDDTARARDLVERTAFLQFQITDETRALDKVMPRIDKILRDKGVDVKAGSKPTDTAASKALTGLLTSGDT